MKEGKNFKSKILVADDEKVNVEFFQVMLSKLGYIVEVAYDGEEVFQKLHEFDPDLILLDLLMPKLSGFQVVRKLKRNSLTRDIPIIILTAVSDIKEKVDMLEQGIDDYIIKPFNFIEILARIRSVLRAKTLREELNENDEKLEFVRKFEKPLLMFLENAHLISKKLIESGEEELKRTTRERSGRKEPHSIFAQTVVDTQKDFLKSIEDIKCKYGELFDVIHRGEKAAT